MKRVADFIYRLGNDIFKYLFLVFMGILSAGALIITEMSNNMSEQKMVMSVDRLIYTLPLTILLAAAGIALGLLAKKKPRVVLNVMTVLVCVWYFAAGTVLILLARSKPGADAWTVYQMADAVSGNDLSVIDPRNSYMSYYPQQIGLTTFLAGILWVLHHFTLPIAEFHVIKFLYVVMICIATVAQYRVVRRLWESDAACCIYLFISAINLPYIMYSTFLYSEIPSYCFFSLGVWFLTEIMAKEYKRPQRIVLAGFSVVFFTIAVMLRKNILVLMIAVLIATVFHFLKTKRPEWLIYTGVCAICCITILPAVVAVYEHAAGRELYSGVTAKSYFAMGMQDDSTRGPGWYNGFNFNTYERAMVDMAEAGKSNSDAVAEEANRVSGEAISERLAYFKANPGYAVGFYARKFSTQWYDGTYASLQATQATESNRAAFFNELYEGKYTAGYVNFCNALQNVVYIGALIGSISLARRKKETDFWKYMLAIGVFGGFLFHMLWEACSRYIVTYSFLLIPYAAFGLSLVPRLFKKSSKVS